MCLRWNSVGTAAPFKIMLSTHLAHKDKTQYLGRFMSVLDGWRIHHDTEKNGQVKNFR